MAYAEILAEVSDRVGTVTLNRPAKKNALSIRLRDEVTACLEAWRDSPEVSAVIFRGAGGTFSSGFDRTELLSADKEVQREVYRSSRSYHLAVMSFPKPTIAALEGFALGGGFDLAVLCDVRLAAESAVFGHPEVKFGGPPLVSPLRRIVGEGWARDLCLSGRRIDSATAFRIGLVTHLVSSAELYPRALAVAREILEAPALALALTKRFFLEGQGASMEECFAREHDRTFELSYGLPPLPPPSGR
ncbi:MAG: enoyl-CoA hydratase/isomerase family protein [Myxococcales bacterium]|nr:enoyl-CoA hydratase/isomerase family protein [Myxococcales bacterium]